MFFFFFPSARRGGWGDNTGRQLASLGAIVACCSITLLLLIIIIITSCIIASTSYLSSWGVQALCVIYLICKDFLEKSVSACPLYFSLSVCSPMSSVRFFVLTSLCFFYFFLKYLSRCVWSWCVTTHSSSFLWRGGKRCSSKMHSRECHPDRKFRGRDQLLVLFLSPVSTSVSIVKHRKQHFEQHIVWAKCLLRNRHSL